MSPAKKLSARKRKAVRRPPYELDVAISSFQACPRCSSFVTGYRLIHDDFEDAVSQSDDSWLELSWNHETRRLIIKSYGIRIDDDVVHLEGICKECQRAFVISSPDENSDKNEFRIVTIPD
jgi:hypothetical protein